MPKITGSLHQRRSKEHGEEMGVRDVSGIKPITETQKDIQVDSEESKRWT